MMPVVLLSINVVNLEGITAAVGIYSSRGQNRGFRCAS